MYLTLVMSVCALGQATTISDSSCLLPAYPANGRYIAQINQTKAPGDEVSRWTVLEYSCSLGYVSSDKQSLCQGNNVWTPNPTCARHCTLYVSYTVDYSCFSANNLPMSCQPAMPHESYVHFDCKTGHSLSGTQTLDEMVCRNGSWSVLTPQCEPECGLDIADGKPLIINGAIAVSDSLPWHVAVYKVSGLVTGFICGGTLISSRLVIGAAHCFYDDKKKRPMSAQLFRVAANKHFQAWDHPDETHAPKSEVREIRLHEWYTGLLHHYQNDLALIVLKTPFELSHTVGPICIDLVSERSDNYQLSSGTKGKFAGWGVTETEELAAELRMLSVPIIDHRTCFDEYVKYNSERFITPDKICAGYTNGSSGCNGDSGAGLVIPSSRDGQQIWWLRGVLSVAPRDGLRCRSNTYTAFTKFFALRDWLKRQINELSSQRELFQEVPDSLDRPGNASTPCSPSETATSTSSPVCQGALLFEDTFTSLSDEIWKAELRFVEGPDYPFVVYLDDENNLYVKNQKLYIKPDLLENKYGEGFVSSALDLGDRCTGEFVTDECKAEQIGSHILPPIISAKVQSKNAFSFKYGKVEVIAKMPKGDWIYPEILLEPTRKIYGSKNYASGTIRVALVRGNSAESKVLHGGLLMGSDEPLRSFGQRQLEGKSPWSDRFVNYTLVWKPDTISLYADGLRYATIAPPAEGFAGQIGEGQPVSRFWRKGTVLAPFDQMFYVSLAVHVGGINEFPDVPNKPWKNKAIKGRWNFWKARDQWYPTWSGESSALQVDSVRIYAL